MTTSIPVFGSAVQADTAASPNSLAQRDGSGGLAANALAATSIANSGTQAVLVTTITSSATLGTHNVVLVDATSGAVVPTLPPAAASAGRCYTVKKIDSSGNNVTIAGNGAEVIDGANTKVISSQWTSVRIVCNGTAWFTV